MFQNQITTGSCSQKQKKAQNQRITDSDYIKNFKEPSIFMKEPGETFFYKKLMIL
jgi:hypothetical protein